MALKLMPGQLTVRQMVELTKEKAEADEDYKLTCIHCKCKVVFIEALEAVMEGHIYSLAGRKEFNISGYCEFCFDTVTLEIDGDNEVPVQDETIPPPSSGT